MWRCGRVASLTGGYVSGAASFVVCFPNPPFVRSVVLLSIASLFFLPVLFLAGLQALPDCLALHLARAEQSELAGDMDGARAAFENLVTTAPSALAYIHFMRFVRRVDGAPAARKAFARCRKDSAVTADTAHITYIAAAHIEYFLNKESRIARNVFELGAFLAWASSRRICMVAVLLIGGSGVARCLQWVRWIVLRHPILFRSSSALAEWYPRTSRCCHLCVGWGGVLVSAFFSPVDTVTSCCVLHPLDHCTGSAPNSGHLSAQLIQEHPLAFSRSCQSL